MQREQGIGLERSASSVPSRQRVMPARQTKCTTGVPSRRRAQEASREKAAFRLIPRMRVEALKKITGLPAGAGARRETPSARRNVRQSCLKLAEAVWSLRRKRAGREGAI